LGLINVVMLSAIPPISDIAAFTHAWLRATQAGRLLSLLYGMGFTVSFAYLLRAWGRDWGVAAVGAFLLAFSGGMAVGMRILRTDLLPAWFFTCALLMLLIAARRGERWWRPAVVGAASLLATLAMLNKIQFLFLICALPIVMIPFGPDEMKPAAFWQASP